MACRSLPEPTKPSKGSTVLHYLSQMPPAWIHLHGALLNDATITLIPLVQQFPSFPPGCPLLGSQFPKFDFCSEFLASPPRAVTLFRLTVLATGGQR